MTTVSWQRAENAVIAIAVIVTTLVLGYDWWWLLALFLAFDLSALGYLISPRAGAQAYNAVHSYWGPAVLAVVALTVDARWAGLLALAWAFHVAVDRALGYGLKEGDSFQHTHLGWIGKGRHTPE
ncbi:DUF4260 family protein [Demequina activiva]|uniref:DUF4260 domain-containing protein n=1 Tax=Demequina activiva TaxID=1582364 RepID=A0A919Q5Q1_9MICO|nr:DUF4260 family protein [Demequina activiva]GIG54305.1 hypothetical protein Dac01nite_10570 [Demequina activiva]